MSDISVIDEPPFTGVDITGTRLRSLGNSKNIRQNNAIFSSDFQLTCCEVIGNNLISPHVEDGRLRPKHYINLPENLLSLATRRTER
jgi:hypothetical protein